MSSLEMVPFAGRATVADAANSIAAAAVPTVPEIIDDLLVIMRQHTKSAGEGWNGATTIEQAGIDSFDFVELIFDLEDKYQININFNSNAADQSLATVEDVARFVQAQIRQERSAK
jgi:acyl carrier protein